MFTVSYPLQCPHSLGFGPLHMNECVSEWVRVTSIRNHHHTQSVTCLDFKVEQWIRESVSNWRSFYICSCIIEQRAAWCPLRRPLRVPRRPPRRPNWPHWAGAPQPTTDRPCSSPLSRERSSKRPSPTTEAHRFWAENQGKSYFTNTA